MRKVVYLGGTGGLGKTTLGHSIRAANPDKVDFVNATATLMRWLNVDSRDGLHQFTEANKLNATVAAIRDAIAKSVADVIIIDGHYAVETRQDRFETGCYPEPLNGTITDAIHLVANSDDIRCVRQVDHSRLRSTDRDFIRSEMAANQAEVGRLRNSGVAITDLSICLQSLGTRWNLQCVFDKLNDIAGGDLRSPHVLDDRPSVTLGPYSSIIANSLDELVIAGADFITRHGSRIESRSGPALQAYDVTYTLKNSRDRVHNIRAPFSVRYLCNELLAYFAGSLDVAPLVRASTFWQHLSDSDGKINSNYGYYVFREAVPTVLQIVNQFEWVLYQLRRNKDSRKAFININQTYHKTDTKDFPCTIGLQLYVRDDVLHCTVSSRSTDIFTGLPYDMGFFSFVNELVWQCLKNDYPNLILGPTTMRTNFTQIYDRTSEKVDNLLANATSSQSGSREIMPQCTPATYNDIMSDSNATDVLKWIQDKSSSS